MIKNLIELISLTIGLFVLGIVTYYIMGAMFDIVRGLL